MSYWEVLGINPTTDLLIIKKAYADKLKLNRPDDDPQGFQKLRAAYDQAVNYTKFNYIIDEDNIESDNEGENKTTIMENVPDDIFNLILNQDKEEKIYINKKLLDRSLNENPISNSSNIKINDIINNYEDQISSFFRSLRILYDNFFERIEVRNWEKLFNDEVIWNLDIKESINRKLLDFFVEYSFIPREIWKFLNKIFCWNEREYELRAFYPDGFIKYLFLQIGEDRIPRYCYFKKDFDINYEEYLHYRETAFLALQDKDLNKAAELMALAYEIYQQDPDLYCMKGELYYKNNDSIKAETEFTKAIKINKYDMYLYFYKAQLFYDIGFYEDTSQICSYIIRKQPDYTEARLLAGKCLYRNNKWNEALRIFIGNLKRNPNDIISEGYLIRIRNGYKKFIKNNPLSISKHIGLMKINQVLDEPKEHIRLKFDKDSVKAVIEFIKIVMLILLLVGLAILSHGIIILIIIAIKYFENEKRKKYPS